MPDTKVLVVEDDPQMQRLLRSQLSARGFTVEIVATGAEAIDRIATTEPAIVLLDIGLPDTGGLEVCRQVREWSSIPVILVTAADTPQMKVSGLELGADDYLTKPFHVGELVARMHAVLRRAATDSVPVSSVVEAGDLRVDRAARQVWCAGEEIRLTRTEFDLLNALVAYPDRVITYRQLLDAVWGEGYDDVRNVHVYVCSLRRKIETGPIGPRRVVSVPGVGYRFRLHDSQ